MGVLAAPQKLNVYILNVVLFNSGASDALRPELRVVLTDYKEGKTQTIFGAFFRLRKQANFTQFVPLTALVEDLGKPDTREFAYALVGQGYSRVEEAPSETWEEFGLAFAFEGDDKFFLAEDKFSIVPHFPLGKELKIALYAKFPNEEHAFLGLFTIKPTSWNKIDLIKDED